MKTLNFGKNVCFERLVKNFPNFIEYREYRAKIEFNFDIRSNIS